MSDLRLAARLLLKNRGFGAVAILSLALGIGANTTIFSLLNGLLLTPLPGRDPGGLATVYTSDSSGPLYSASSYPDYRDFKDSDAFETLSAHTLKPALLTIQGESQRVLASLMTGNTFEMLGLRAAYGRLLLPVDEAPGQHPVIVLGHGIWRRRFGADPSVVGRSVALNGHPHTIVGVGPAGFSGLLRGVAADVFVPLAMHDALSREPLDHRGNRGLMLLGRLRHGATPESARACLAVIAARLHQAYRDYWTDVKDEPRVVSVLPETASRLLPQMSGPISGFLAVLLAIVGLVLLLACSNVANLLLARASARRREIAVRVALGAGRLQLLRQLLAESALLSLLAGGLGLGFALAATRLVGSLQPPLPVTLALGMHLDLRVLLFTLVLSVGTGIAFGLLPALSVSGVGPMEALRAGGTPQNPRRRFGVRNVLVVGQVAGSVLLLVCTGLFLRSLGNAEAIDPGFSPRGVVVFSVDLNSRGYDEARGALFYDRMRERLATVPGVVSVSLASRLPLSLGGGRRSLQVEGYQPRPGEDMEVHFSEVSPDYFETMKTPIASGRGFVPADAAGPGAVVVNEAFVRRFWPGEPALGRRVVVPRRAAGALVETPMEVVGITRDGKYNSLGEEPTPFIYYPSSHLYSAEMNVLLRAQVEPARLGVEVRKAMAALDPNLPVYDFRTLEEHLGIALFPVRAVAWLLGLMGVLALFLAVLGLYGVLAYSVSCRTREIGIRMALGARRDTVVTMILGFGARLTLTGLALGLLAALGVTRFLKFLLYGISPVDPLTFVLIPSILLAVSLAAAALPARRASRVEPAIVLREE
jgi:macrolide transport system ATP-binding/permease protein